MDCLLKNVGNELYNKILGKNTLYWLTSTTTGSSWVNALFKMSVLG